MKGISSSSSASGSYAGGVYFGAIQMLAEPTGRRLAGKWAGFGRDLEINVGPWRLQLVSSDASGRVQRHSRKNHSFLWVVERPDERYRRLLAWKPPGNKAPDLNG